MVVLSWLLRLVGFWVFGLWVGFGLLFGFLFRVV